MKKFLFLGLTMLIATSCVLNLNTPFVYDNANQYSILENSEDFNVTVDEVEVGWVAGNVNIEFHDKSYVSISETKKESVDNNLKLHYLFDGSKLYVQYCNSGNNLKRTPDKEVTIKLPKTTSLKKVSVDNKSGNIDAYFPDCDINNVSVNNVNGNVLFSTNNVNKSEINVTNGNVDLYFDYIKKIEINITNGNATFQSIGTAPDSIEINTVNGNQNVSIPDNSGFTASVSIILGQFSNNFGSKKYGNGSRAYEFNTTLGNISLFKL